MGARPMRLAAASLVLAVVTTLLSAEAQPDPFTAINALRVTPPVLAPDVAFQALDGREARLATLRGRPVLLTFFTTW